jgi:hypothetical protein
MPPEKRREIYRWRGVDCDHTQPRVRIGLRRGFEISLFRAFRIVNPSSAYNFPAVLAPFLLAIALGSIIFTRGTAECGDAILTRVGGLLIGSALALLTSIAISSYLRVKGYPISFNPILQLQHDRVRDLFVIVFAVSLVMPVPLLTGAIFPSWYG